jgi:putative PIN family toxin of toxin-antitoxin system
MQRIVLDTNVFITALRSQNGAGFKLLSQVDKERFRLVLSVPLVLEYEEVAKRQARSLGLSHSDIDDIIDYLCGVGEHRRVFFLWRPLLRDPHDDLVLELAVEAQADAIVTYNIRDFELARTFGLDVLTPQQFLRRLEVRK